MKSIYKISSVIFVAVGLFVNSAALAQDKYKTSESVGKQLKENSVPGQKYGPESRKTQERTAVDQKQETKGNIRDVIFTAGVPSSTSKTSKSSRTILSKSTPSKLPSDVKPEKEEKKEVAIPKPPSQGEDKKTD